MAFFFFPCFTLESILSFDPSLKLAQSFSKILTQTLLSHLTLKSASGIIHLHCAPLPPEGLFVLPSFFLWSPLSVAISRMMIKHRPPVSTWVISLVASVSLQRALCLYSVQSLHKLPFNTHKPFFTGTAMMPHTGC